MSIQCSKEKNEMPQVKNPHKPQVKANNKNESFDRGWPVGELPKEVGDVSFCTCYFCNCSL